MVMPPRRPGGGSLFEDPPDPPLKPPRERDAVQAAALEVLLERGRDSVLAVTGESMRPTVGPGADVRVSLPARPRFGDLIVFRQADYLAVHRYLGVATGPGGIRCLRTRGDGVSALDPPLAPGDVRGRVVAIARPDGWRSLDGAGARAYSVAVALHDLAWAGAASRASRIHGGLGRGAELLDRGLLRVADRLLFRALHRRTPPPAPGS